MRRTAQHLSRVTPLFDFYVVLDFEAAFDAPRPKFMDIIEYPSVLVNAHTMQVVSEFHHYVKPLTVPEIHPKCTELTGITPDMVATSEPFPVVHQWWKEWLAASSIGALPAAKGDDNALQQQRSFCFVTCGDWDIKTMMPTQFTNCGLTMDQQLEAPMYSQWCNLKDIFNDLYKPSPRKITGMAGMLRHLKIPLVGRHHSGIDDCRNITRVLQRVVADHGPACIDVTGYRTRIPGQQPDVSPAIVPLDLFSGDMTVAVAPPHVCEGHCFDQSLFDPTSTKAIAAEKKNVPSQTKKVAPPPPCVPSPPTPLSDMSQPAVNEKLKAMSTLKPFFRSALVILPPASVAAKADATRATNDKGYGRWMSHITLLFPFLPPSAFGDAIETIEASVKSTEMYPAPFTVRADKVSWFPGKKAVLHVVPEVVEGNPSSIEQIYNTLLRMFPNLKRADRDGFHAHLTLGQFAGHEAAKKAKEIERSWGRDDEGDTFKVTEFHLIAHLDGESAYKVIHTFKLPGGSDSAHAGNDVDGNPLSVGDKTKTNGSELPTATTGDNNPPLSSHIDPTAPRQPTPTAAAKKKKKNRLQ